MDIIIKNGNLITMDNNRERYEASFDILISEGLIKKIGKNIDDPNAKVIDATNKIVMPGIINAHTHLGMSIFRETLDGYDLQTWLSEQIWPMEAQMTPDDIYWAALLSGIEMLKTGTTMANDMYFYPEKIIEAAEKVGLRIQTTRFLMSINGDGDSRLEELDDLINTNKAKENITFNVGLHSLYTSDEDYVKKCIAFAQTKELPVHIHFCENQAEEDSIKKTYQMLPVTALEKFFSAQPVILAHAVKLSANDIKRLGKMNVSVVHCPISNLKLGCGIAKVQTMLENNINVALGTDGQGSGSNLDMFEVMKFTALLQKGINEDAKSLPAYEVLKMATINGAKALGLDKEIGSLTVGKKADIIIISSDSVTMQPVNNILADIVYNAKGSSVETVLINGKIVMENQTIHNVCEKEVYKQSTNIINRIKKNRP